MHVFSAIEPEPNEAQIRAGVRELDRLDVDVIIAVGGRSMLDAAKVTRLFHESPSVVRPRPPRSSPDGTTTPPI